MPIKLKESLRLPVYCITGVLVGIATSAAGWEWYYAALAFFACVFLIEWAVEWVE